MSLIERAVQKINSETTPAKLEAKHEDIITPPEIAAPSQNSVATETVTPVIEKESPTVTPTSAQPSTTPPSQPTQQQNVAQTSEDEGKEDTAYSEKVFIDFNMLRKRGFLTPDTGSDQQANEYRMIKRPLLHNVDGKGATKLDNANIIMVTSSMPGEGKTTTAVNLAISMAMEKDRTVLLIDADVAKPSLNRVLNIDKNRGLTDILLGDVEDVGDVMCSTNIPSLKLLFAGNKHLHATELLASVDMAEFVKEISTRYPDRVIIFDSPPMLLTTEATALSEHMGQVVVVVEAEKTKRTDLQTSLSTLSNEIVLLLLNKQKGRAQGQYGYYGYGHQ